MAKLSQEDRRIAEAQVFCAIDQDSPLGTMGPIHKVVLKGQPVFLCCKGCVAEARAHPDETLASLQKLRARRRSDGRRLRLRARKPQARLVGSRIFQLVDKLFVNQCPRRP
jgi:hypothetical protein